MAGAAAANRREVVDGLLARYCALLDDDRLEDWCELFAESGSYRILSRENVVQQLPGAILLLENRAMIVDRIVALRQAAVYNAHVSRHLYSAVQAIGAGDGTVRFSANVSVYQSDPDGHTRLFCVGQYRGTVAPDSAAPLIEQTVIVDTFAIPTLLAVPI